MFPRFVLEPRRIPHTAPNTGLLDNLCMNTALQSLPQIESIEHPALDIGLGWLHGFSKLGADFFTELAPETLPAPYWVGRSAAVARLLGLN